MVELDEIRHDPQSHVPYFTKINIGLIMLHLRLKTGSVIFNRIQKSKEISKSDLPCRKGAKTSPIGTGMIYRVT